VRYLAQAGARIIVFDLTFEAPSPQPEQDRAVLRGDRAAGNVLVTETVRKETQALDDATGQPVANLVISGPRFRSPSSNKPCWGMPVHRAEGIACRRVLTTRGGAADAPSLPVLAAQLYASEVSHRRCPSRNARGSTRPWPDLRSTGETAT